MRVAEQQYAGNPAAHTGIDTARERRIDLREAMARVELQIARPSATSSWRADVEAALIDLGEALDAHANEVEVEDGLLASIVSSAPRLAGQVAEVKGQHAELRTAFDRSLAACSQGEVEATVVRRRVTSLLGRLAIHRQLGSELVFDAYNVDIGDGD